MAERHINDFILCVCILLIVNRLFGQRLDSVNQLTVTKFG